MPAFAASFAETHLIMDQNPPAESQFPLSPDAMDGLFAALNEYALVAIMDTGFVITYANDAFNQLLYPAGGNALGASYPGLICEKYMPGQWDLVETDLDGGKNWQGELCLRAGEGEFFWVRSLFYAVRGPDGKASQYVSIMRNISWEKKIEMELRDSQHLVYEAARVARLGAWEYDCRTGKLYWSPTTKEIHEVDPDYVPDIESGIAFYEASWARGRIRECVRRAIEEGVAYDEELLILTAKGRECWVRAIGQSAFQNGQCVRIYGVLQDIDREKRLRINYESASSFMGNLLDSATEFSFIATDCEGMITVFNSGAEKLLGYEKEEVLGRRSPDIFHVPEEVSAYAGELKDALGRTVEGFEIFVAKARQEGLDRREWTYLRKDGARVPVVLIVTPMRDPEGQVRGYVGVARDISLRKQALKELHESEQRFRSAFENSGSGMVIADLDGTWTEVNQKLCRMLGYSPSDLVGRHFREFVHPDDLELGMDLNREAVQGERNSYQLYKRYLHAKGHELWMNLTVSLVRDAEGNPLHFISQMEDVTANRELEARLLATKDRLTVATRGSGIGIWEWNILNGELIWDEQMFRLYGRSPLKVVASYELWYESLHEGDRERMAEIVRQVLEGNADFDTEFRIVWPNGAVRHMRGISIVQFDEEGQALRMIGTNWDITHTVEQREELARLAHRAEEANRAKSQFLANMSHEIRTPLNGIIGMAEILSEVKSLEPEQQECVDIINSSGMALLGLINDILDFSKIEAGRLELAIRDFSLGELLGELDTMFLHKANGRGLGFYCEVKGDVPDKLRGDPARIRQVLVNLIGNAIKFTARGRVDVVVEKTASRRRDNSVMLRFAVKDTGIGIKRALKDKLFKEFSQIDSSTSRLYGGTGLGLAISKNLVGLMDGRIGCESEYGSGAEFWFILTLPVVEVDVPDAAEPAPETRPVAKSWPKHVGRYQDLEARVLFAEDNRTNQLVAATLLKRTGLKIDFVENGIEAIEALKSKDYDLVLMDVQMPRMDGHEASRRIRSGEAGEGNREIPIIAVTAHARPEDSKACFDAGINAYISKPIDRNKLIVELDAFLLKSGPHVQVISPPDRPAEDPDVMPVFDRDEYLNRLMQDVASARDAAARACQEMEQHHRGVREGLVREDPETLRFHLHSLKGVALNCECCSLSALARELQMYPIESLLEEVLERADELSKAKNAALKALQSFLAE
ncbi:PAS domain S-box protein [Coraliomargarita parva]|uniref:PAS domain S-box protein n=1 Tax=Coraliomargarita parva TaxID=3014050 RepID=UPI0022B445B0|nr:PAS domain S-box protein [Coraliomargarita parva]